MVKQDCVKNGERISKLEVRCEEYDHRTTGQLNFIINVNKDSIQRDRELEEKTDKHERIINFFIGGFSTVTFVLSCIVALKQIGVIK